jgi:outer membrane receptor protein involved in Fe transport
MHLIRLSRPVPGSALLLSAFLAFALAPAPRLSAQAALNPPAAAITAGAEDEEIVIMTPFDVVAQSKDDGRYETSRSNAITGTNLPLDRVPLTANIFNSAFLEDMDIVDVNEMLTKYAGFGVPFDGNTSGAGLRGAEPGDRTDFKNLTVRGLGAGVTRREGFLLSEGTSLDGFDLDSVEQINGSQSLIYGAGNAGGVVNYKGKRALFNRRYGRAKLKIDSEGSRRYEAEANYGTRTFAVTAIGIKDDTFFWKPGLERHHRGYYAAVAYTPTNWLILRGEYRNFDRTEINSQSAEVSVPAQYLPDWAQTGSGDPNLGNRRIRYFLYREGDGYMGFNWSNADSAMLVSARKVDHEYYGVAAEARVTNWFSLQLRYGNDERTNFALMQNSSVTLFHPRATADSRDAYFPELAGQWTYRVSPSENSEHAGTTFQSQRGFRLAGNLRFKTGKIGRHEFNFSYQNLDSRNKRVGMRFYKLDDDGNFVYANDVGNANRVAWNSASNNSDALWVPAFSANPLGARWPTTTVTVPAGPGAGTSYPARAATVYKLAPIKIPGFTEATPYNPLGLNNGTYSRNIDGSANALSAAYRILDFDEDAAAGVLMSSWWDDRITTMLGYRFEQFTVIRQNTGLDELSMVKDPVTGEILQDGRPIHKRGPLSKNTFTAGIVFDITKDISAFVSHSTNTNVKQDFEQLDVYNQLVPFGQGVSNEFGFKFKLFNRRINGSASAFKTTVKNETIALYDWRAEISRRDMIDPDGLNGRSLSISPEPVAVRDRTSQGIGISFTAKPMRGWEMSLRYSFADGKSGSDVILPVYNNDTFHTITNGSETYVARRLPDGTLRAVAVPTDLTGYTPGTVYDIGDPDTEPLSVNMMRNNESHWYALLTRYGSIAKESTRSPVYDILRRDDVRTGNTGLLITGAPNLLLAGGSNPLGVATNEGISTDGTFLLEKSGEKTIGYAVNTFAMENTFYIRDGWFKGLQLGVQFQYQRNVRGYYYYVTNPESNVKERKLWMLPNSWNLDASARYEFKFGKRIIWTIQLNVINLLDQFKINPKVDGSGRIIVGTPGYAPRRFVLTNVIRF